MMRHHTLYKKLKKEYPFSASDCRPLTCDGCSLTDVNGGVPPDFVSVSTTLKVVCEKDLSFDRSTTSGVLSHLTHVYQYQHKLTPARLKKGTAQ